jgi:hypothetical protein
MPEVFPSFFWHKLLILVAAFHISWQKILSDSIIMAKSTATSYILWHILLAYSLLMA